MIPIDKNHLIPIQIRRNRGLKEEWNSERLERKEIEIKKKKRHGKLH